MASHHLRHHPTATSYCYCCSPYSLCHYHRPPPPPPPPPPDCHPLYHSQPQPYLYSAKTHLPNLYQTHPHFQEHYLEEEIETQYNISSLLRRIDALESALRRRSSFSNSLRDAAARTIQTHFRAFLLRRSRTLRQLKDLASIKSTLIILKSSVSKPTPFDCDEIYHQAMELVLRLDTIQGGDPMIREGKSSVMRELNNFLGFIDGIYLERKGLPSGVNIRYKRTNMKSRFPNGEQKVGNVKYGGLKSATMDKFRGLVERVDKLAEELNEEEESEVLIEETPDVFTKTHRVSGNKNGGLVKKLCGVQPKVKKSVSFVDNGKVYRVLRRNSPILDENDDGDSVDRVNLVSRDFEDDLCREVEEIGVMSKEAEDDDDDEVEAHSGNGSDGEKELSGYLRNEGSFDRKIYNQGEADSIAFSAPLPLKMETRADLVDKRKKLADNL